MIEACVPAGPCILLDGQLGVVQLNHAAQGLLGANAQVLAVRQQRLQAPGDPLALARCLASAARGERTAMSLARPGQAPLSLLAERLSAVSGDRGARQPARPRT